MFFSERGRSEKEAEMKRDGLQKRWQGKSDAILAGVAEWRAAHPKAILREIEAEIDERLSELRAKMISDTANESVTSR
jgi:hypothetical protein